MLYKIDAKVICQLLAVESMIGYRVINVMFEAVTKDVIGTTEQPLEWPMMQGHVQHSVNGLGSFMNWELECQLSATNRSGYAITKGVVKNFY